MLPKLDGLEVCKRLRAVSHVPIIMLTARDDEVDKVLGPRARRRRLHHEAVLDPGVPEPRQGGPAPGGGAEARRRTGSEPISIDGLVVDPARRAVTAERRAGRADVRRVRAAVDAGCRGRDACTAGRRCSSRSGGTPHYRDPRTIDVHVRHLREKLEPTPSEPRVHPDGARRRLPLPGRVNPLRSVGARLSLALLLVVVGALELVYLAVAPSLESRLINSRLNDLERSAPTLARAARRAIRSIPTSSRAPRRPRTPASCCSSRSRRSPLDAERRRRLARRRELGRRSRRPARDRHLAATSSRRAARRFPATASASPR